MDRGRCAAVVAVAGMIGGLLGSSAVPANADGSTSTSSWPRQQLVSVAADGGAANGASGGDAGCVQRNPCVISGPDVAMSGDGEVVAFRTTATNLVPGASSAGLVVRDRRTQTTVLVSPGGKSPSLDGDGEHLAYASTDLRVFLGGRSDGPKDVFVRDLSTGRLSLETPALDGGLANGDSYAPAISSDGAVVAFASTATNMVAGDTNGRRDVFVRDLGAGTTTRVSDVRCATAPSMTADGQRVLYHTVEYNSETWGIARVFDRRTGKVVDVAPTAGGVGAILSGDGSTVAYGAPGDLPWYWNGQGNICPYDLYVRTAADRDGYTVISANGNTVGFGSATALRLPLGVNLNAPVVGGAMRPGGAGYWLLGRDGDVFSFGDAQFFGSTGAIRLNQPIVGMAATSDGNGYRFVAADGGVFCFGDTEFIGSDVRAGRTAPAVALLAG